MSVKLSPRPRKHNLNEMKQEIVAQVHKSGKSSSQENIIPEDVIAPSSKTYTKLEDRNENFSLHNTPSREISVDSETQINSKIISLIETEMKRDKHSHFTDSRPQSLSFYEDEKVPEELSGNLELLSPEERKHYRKRREYSQMDTDEMNAYNVIQDLYNTREADEILSSSTKKSKSRKKRHGESEMGMGDSREMMIPKEKRKSKKKKHETSPMSGTGNKRKHKKRDDDYEPRTEITVALEELQDDVFENNIDDLNSKVEKMKKSPRKSDKLYVQRKNKFEVTTRNNGHLNRQSAQDFEDGVFERRNFSRYPLEVAICYQQYWMRISNLCHGLLSGLALGHWLYLIANQHEQNEEFLTHYARYSDIYVGLFYTLCVFCIVSVFDKVDVAHMDSVYFTDIIKSKKFTFVIVIYVTCLLVHLSATTYDDKIAIISYGNETANNITDSELSTWNHLSLWRAILALLAWLFVGLGPAEDTLLVHIKTMEKYLPGK